MTKSTGASPPALTVLLTLSYRINYQAKKSKSVQMSCMKHTRVALFTPSFGNSSLPRIDRHLRSGLDIDRWTRHIPSLRILDGSFADPSLQRHPSDCRQQKYPYYLTRFRRPPRVTTLKLFFSWCVHRILMFGSIERFLFRLVVEVRSEYSFQLFLTFCFFLVTIGRSTTAGTCCSPEASTSGHASSSGCCT